MQQNTNILRGRPWLLLLLLFAWLLPQQALADDSYVESVDNYTVSLGGSNIVYFEAPVYDKVGVFVNEECRGLVTLSADGSTQMVIYGRKAGELVTLKYYDAISGLLFTIPDAVKL